MCTQLVHIIQRNSTNLIVLQTIKPLNQNYTKLTNTARTPQLNKPSNKQGEGGGVNPIVVLIISSSWVILRLHNKTQLSELPGSSLIVGVVVVGVEGEFSDWLWLEPSIGQSNQLNVRQSWELVVKVQIYMPIVWNKNDITQMT